MSEGAENVLVSLCVNERWHEISVGADDTLMDVLRDRLRLTSCRETCGLGLCGSCTVVVNGRAVSACIAPAFTLDGASIGTAEGLAGEAGLSPLQEAFVREQAFQCSFCTPGFLMSATAMLDDGEEEPDVEGVLSGHLCRCGSYRQILDAVRQCAGQCRGGSSGQANSRLTTSRRMEE
jgi:carbon-monoxide dehydrogenase small subunit